MGNERKKQEELRRELQESERRMSNCSHIFKDPIFDPETYNEEYLTGEYETNGNHMHPLTSYRESNRDRWGRECEVCGKMEYTYKTEPIVTNYKPKF
jgi:hypothetical protein